MGFFEQFFGTELALPARAVVALILVLALIALTVWLVRRFGDTRVVRNAAGRGRQQRLAVLDAAVVDARRKLVLIRRDNVEHLLLLGGPTDVVVEPNIVRAAPLGGPARAPRPGVYEAIEPEPETPLVPQPEPGYPDSERAPAPRPYYEQPQPVRPAPEPARPVYEAPRAAPQRAPQRHDAQYNEMAQRLEQALRKPTPEPEVTQRAAPAPRAPEPRTYTPPPPRTPEPRAARGVDPRAPEPRPAPPPAPAAQPSAADVFESLEEEMASLLRPPGKKDQ
jgi:flagellar biogenesis protein FliO